MWTAIYQIATGRLVSLATQVAAPLPADLAVLPLADRPGDDQMWDETTRQFVGRPAKVLLDRLQDLLTQPAYSDWQEVYNSLTPIRRQRVREMLIRLLGRQRYRNVSEPVELE